MRIRSWTKLESQMHVKYEDIQIILFMFFVVCIFALTAVYMEVDGLPCKPVWIRHLLMQIPSVQVFVYVVTGLNLVHRNVSIFFSIRL